MRTILILAGVLVVLIAIATVSEQARKKRRHPGEPLYPGFRTESVARIELSKDDQRVELARGTDGIWRVASEGDYPADTGKVARVLEHIPAFHTRNLVSRNPEKQDEFEVTDSLGTEVLLTAADGSEVAHFYVGKQGPDFMSTYVRPAGEDVVLLVPKYLRTAYDIGQSTWRDRTIFSFETGEAARVKILPAEGDSLALAKDEDGTWRIVAPDTFAVKESIWNSTLRTASTLKCDAFPDSIPDPETLALDPPQQQLEIDLEDGRRLALLVGGQDDRNRHYVRRAGDPTIFLLSKGRVSALMKDLAALKEEPAESGGPDEPATTSGK